MIRGPKSAMPKKGGKPTNIFSTAGRQKNPPLGDNFRPGMTATAMDKPRKGPVKRDNGLK